MQQAAPQSVQPLSPPTTLLGKLAFLGLLGFLVIIMIGPLVAVVSAILSVIVSLAAVVLSLAIAFLPFALVGLVVWGIYQAAAPGNASARQAFKQRFAEFSRTFVRFTGVTCRSTYQAMRWTCQKGLSCLGYAGHGVQRSMQGIRTALTGRGAGVGRFLLETMCGAALATGVCLAVSDGAPEAIPVGIVGGALLGGAIGWSAKPTPRREPVQLS